MEKTKKKGSEKPHYFGHRERLRQRFLADEGKSMPDYELLELILTAAIPRKDVKLPAKNLINHFHSFGNVLAATPEELLSAGAPRSAMIYLKNAYCVSQRISDQFLKESDDLVLSTTDYVVDFARAIADTFTPQDVVIVYLNGTLKMLQKQIISRTKFNTEEENMRHLMIETLKYRSTAVIVLEKSLDDATTPSSEDKKKIQEMNKALRKIGIKYIEHVIISPQTYYSYRDHQLLLPC